ncbi:MAG: hypothetical protein RL483_649 [Pseudomonadota bacterium]
MTFESLLRLYQDRGSLQYSGEPVSQLEHAWQGLQLAQAAGASPQLQLATFFHDVGHLLQKAMGSPTLVGHDDRHEVTGTALLKRAFAQLGFSNEDQEAIAQPVALHVEAKRYLVYSEPSYEACLSADSIRSLALQGGPMDESEAQRFERRSFFQDAVALRRWDEAAKQGAPEAALVLPSWGAVEGLLHQLVAQCTPTKLAS